MALDGIRMACKQRTVLPKVLGALPVLCCAGEGDEIPAAESELNSMQTNEATKSTKNKASLHVFVHNTVPNHNRTTFHFLNAHVNHHAVL